MNSNQNNSSSTGTPSYSPRTRELMRELNVEIINWNAPPASHVPMPRFPVHFQMQPIQLPPPPPQQPSATNPRTATANQMQPIQLPSPASPVPVSLLFPPTPPANPGNQVTVTSTPNGPSTNPSFSSFSYSEKIYKRDHK